MRSMRNLCWRFYNQRTLNFVHRNFSKVSAVGLQTFSYKNDTGLSGFQNARITCCQKILDKYFVNKEICWDEVIKELENSSIEPDRIKSFIFCCCASTRTSEHGISFYKYLKSKNEKFQLFELVSVLKILSKCKDLNPHVEIVDELYTSFKPILATHEAVHTPAFEVFSKFKSYWKDLVELCFELDAVRCDSVIAGAFDFDDRDTAWKLLNKHPQSFGPHVTQSLFKYCTRAAERNEFNVSEIDDLISFCNYNVFLLPSENILELLEELTNVLNKRENSELNWTVEECTISPQGRCSCCFHTLNSATIDEEDFNKLKNQMLKDIILGENILYKSSYGELKVFLNFLKNVGHYDVVIDGTNLLYIYKRSHYFFNSVVNMFLREKKKVLMIARQHMKSERMVKAYEDKIKIFYTKNDSDDDVFVLYASLFGGQETSFVSCDLFRGYKNYLEQNKEIANLFLKWKISHHYFIQHKQVMLPLIHSVLPQKTVVNNSDDTLIWHLPLLHILKPSLPLDENLRWLCLQARPVSNLKEYERNIVSPELRKVKSVIQNKQFFLETKSENEHSETDVVDDVVDVLRTTVSNKVKEPTEPAKTINYLLDNSNIKKQ